MTSLGKLYLQEYFSNEKYILYEDDNIIILLFHIL